jgi:hypothetical protein
VIGKHGTRWALSRPRSEEGSVQIVTTSQLRIEQVMNSLHSIA